MKRIFALVLTIALVGTLAGCGETGQQEPATPAEPSQTPSQTTAEVSYSGGAGLADDITDWLAGNNIETN